MEGNINMASPIIIIIIIIVYRRISDDEFKVHLTWEYGSSSSHLHDDN